MAANPPFQPENFIFGKEITHFASFRLVYLLFTAVNSESSMVVRSSFVVYRSSLKVVDIPYLQEPKP